MKPFLKWAGGKRWLTQQQPKIIPPHKGLYIEPFLGGGAMFFHFKPSSAILCDSNAQLIECYQAIKDDWDTVFQLLKQHHRKHSNDYYYRIRSTFPRNLQAKAAKFIYLNRTCWNGLYRVNKMGQFNVPIGTKSSVVFKDDDFEKVSKLLKGADLRVADFEEVISLSTEGDLIYIDPPYTVRHNNNSFIKYNEVLFSWLDQERLAKTLVGASERGTLIIGSNAYQDSVKALYKDSFTLSRLSRQSVISGKRKGRSVVDELLFSNLSYRAAL